MALDEAMLEAVGTGQAPPTLRLYAWYPPTLSLGYAQPIADVDRPTLESHGWQLVRRPTGGRAILHTDELTYAVIAPSNEPRLAGGVLESYQRISQALLHALQRLALPAEAQENPDLPLDADTSAPVCFEVPSNYEITVAGKKLIGSAQARRRSGVLQHGTLPLYGDLTRITQALAFPTESARQQAARRLLARATTVEQVLARKVDWGAAAQAFIIAFTEQLNLTLTPGQLSPSELARAEELVQVKYANASWTERC